MPWFRSTATPLPEITPTELAKALKGPQPPLVVDVREPFEWQGGHIPGALLIPLGQLPSRMAELPKDREIVAICRSGHRSTTACSRLAAAGFRVKNATGGYLQWAGELQSPAAKAR